MRRMLPKLERIVFIGDERYVSRQTDSDLEELIRSQFSDLEYSSYRAGDMTIDSLFDALQRIDPERDGLLFSSWFSRRQIAGNTVLTSGSYKVIAGFLLPIFSLHYAGMEDSNLVGGYVYDRLRLRSASALGRRAGARRTPAARHPVLSAFWRAAVQLSGDAEPGTRPGPRSEGDGFRG